MRWGEFFLTGVEQVLMVNVGASDLVDSCPGRLDHFKISAIFLFVTVLQRTRLAKVPRTRLRRVHSQSNLGPLPAIPNAAERELESAGCEEASIAKLTGRAASGFAPAIHTSVTGRQKIFIEVVET